MGPALSGVGETFAACDDQFEWVTLGSDRFRDLYGDHYGDTQKPIHGGMPSFEEKLTEEQRRTVISYERISFGGLDEAAVRADCEI